MPKLIIKQEAGAVTRKMNYAKWLSFGGLLFLLITVATAAVLFTKSPIRSSELAPLSLSSAPESATKSGYQLLYEILGELDTEFENVAGQDVDDYQKNLKLLGKSESILKHLDKMDAAALDLGLNADEQKELLNRHQFYKDYWQAKLHFRELRVSRFEGGGKAEDGLIEPIAVDEQDKPESNDLEMDASKADVPLNDSSHTEVVAEDVPVDSTEVGKPKKKFQFAKPPEGMELPAGFCDLTNPDSCKPELASEIEAAPEDLAMPDDSEPVNAPDEMGADKPKKKFQFAKPPEGMKLPDGFCDLTNPDSCKPEAENTSEATDIEAPKKKAINKEVEPSSVEKKSTENVSSKLLKPATKEKPAKQKKVVSVSHTSKNQSRARTSKANLHQQAAKSREQDLQILEESLGIPLN